MIDFTMPNNPGWKERFRKKHGYVDDDVQAVSPAFKRAVQKEQLRAELLKAAAEVPQEEAADAVVAEEARKRDLTAI